VDDHLVAVAAVSRGQIAGECALRHQRQSVRPLLADGRPIVGVLVEELLAGGLERLAQHLTRLRREAAADDEHAVLVDVGGHGAGGVAQFVLAGLDGPVDAAPGPHGPFDLRCCCCPAEVDEGLLRVRPGDPGQRPDLGVGELPALHRVADQRQFGQRPDGPRPLARRVGRETGAPGEPMGAACKAVLPPLLFVERSDQNEQFVGRRIDASGEGGDLFSQSFPGGQVREVGVSFGRFFRSGSGGCDGRRGFGRHAGAPDGEA